MCVWENVFDGRGESGRGRDGRGRGSHCTMARILFMSLASSPSPCLPPFLFLLYVPLLLLSLPPPSHLPSPSIPSSKMNTSSVHSTGALLLEPMNQLVIEVKMVHKAAIPLTYETPAEKLKCKLTGSCSFQHHFKFTIVSRKSV